MPHLVPPVAQQKGLPVHEVRYPVGVPHLPVAPPAEVPQGVARLLRADSAEVVDPELGQRTLGPVCNAVALAPARVARAGVLHHHPRPQQAEAARTTPAHPLVRMGRTGGVRWEGHLRRPFAFLRVVSHHVAFSPLSNVSA